MSLGFYSYFKVILLPRNLWKIRRNVFSLLKIFSVSWWLHEHCQPPGPKMLNLLKQMLGINNNKKVKSGNRNLYDNSCNELATNRCWVVLCDYKIIYITKHMVPKKILICFRGSIDFYSHGLPRSYIIQNKYER